ncbi:ankyrin repeat-containing domain protein, partial [Kalaharituber pfeilii]
SEASSKLSEHGANINRRNDSGKTPLENALYHGRVDKVLLLMLHGAKFGNEGAKRPLFWTLEGRNRDSNPTPECVCLELIRLLIMDGAPVNFNLKDPNADITHEDGAEILRTAVELGLTPVADFLIELYWHSRLKAGNCGYNHGTPLSQLAISMKHQPLLNLLLNRADYINVQDDMGQTPLHRAVELGDKATTQLLLHAHAEVMAKDKSQNTPLHIAAAIGHVEIVKLLLSSGADINAENEFKETPLHKAAANEHVAIVQLLLDKGANPEARDKDGLTALLRAANEGKGQTFEMLLNHCAIDEGEAMRRFTAGSKVRGRHN